MAIWQTGWKGNKSLINGDPEWFDGIWGQFIIPKERWLNGAYAWIGCLTEQQKFMQVGIFPQWPNGTINGSKYPGEWIIAYSTDNLWYFLQPYNDVRVRPGDSVILAIMKNPYGTNWQIWAVNTPAITQDPPEKVGGTMFAYDAGKKFHILNLKVVFEGYTGPASETDLLKPGWITIEPVRVRRADINQQIPIPMLGDFQPQDIPAYAVGKYVEPPSTISKNRVDEKFSFGYIPL